MIEDLVYKSFYFKTGLIILKEENRKVEPVSSSNKTNNDFRNKEAYKEYQKNVDNNIKHNNKKDDAFMIQDTCEISKEAMELYEFAKQAVDSIPDIREDKVEDIKNRLDNGTYDISVEALANKIIGKGCL